MKYYLKGTILEAIERAKKLKTKIPNGLDIHFQKLAEISESSIDEIIDTLRVYLTAARYQTDNNQKHRLKDLKKILKDLDILENVVVAAINRYDKVGDVRVNKLVQGICREINYPLTPPTVTCLSKDYYHIYPDFNLLCVPLLECEFLLHLPDLYHELGHPLLAKEDNPKIEPFQTHFKEFYLTVLRHFNKMIKDDAINGDKRREEFYERWRNYWFHWAVEFFCDLFGVYTLGPAYAWAHLHLTAKMGQDPFKVQKFGSHSSHPNDEARMKVICFALDMLGYSNERKMIVEKWEALHSIIPYTIDGTFELAYPQVLLESCAVSGLNAVKAIGCTLAGKDNKDPIFLMLNEAWNRFWKDTDTYFAWEAKSVDKIV